MDGPIITVDVSKGNCHYRPFLEKGKPLRKPKVLYDTIDGFNELYECIEKTKEKAEKDTNLTSNCEIPSERRYCMLLER